MCGDGETATSTSKPCKDIVSQIRERKLGKIKSLFRALKAADDSSREEACSLMSAWIGEELQPQLFVKLAKIFAKFLSSCHSNLQSKFAESCRALLIRRLGQEKYAEDLICGRFLRTEFEKLVKKEDETRLLI